MVVKVSPKRVLGYELVESTDPIVANTFMRIMQNRNIKISGEIFEITRIFKDFYSFAYRINSGAIRSSSEEELLIDWAEFCHEGIHLLIGNRFGVELEGRPRISLLNECIGIGFVIPYVFSRIAEKYKLQFREFRFINDNADNARKMGLNFKEAFRTARMNSFEVFKKTTIESYKYRLKIFECLQSPLKRQPATSLRIISDLEKCSYLALYSMADPVKPVLFVAANCGLKSNSDDMRLTRECLAILKASTSMEDFFRRLEFDKVAQKLEFRL
jgi:hypothetical protein